MIRRAARPDISSGSRAELMSGLYSRSMISSSSSSSTISKPPSMNSVSLLAAAAFSRPLHAGRLGPALWAVAPSEHFPRLFGRRRASAGGGALESARSRRSLRGRRHLVRAQINAELVAAQADAVFGQSAAQRTRCPFTFVPFVVARSRITSSPSVFTTTQCRFDKPDRLDHDVAALVTANHRHVPHDRNRRITVLRNQLSLHQFSLASWNTSPPLDRQAPLAKSRRLSYSNP